MNRYWFRDRLELVAIDVVCGRVIREDALMPHMAVRGRHHIGKTIVVFIIACVPVMFDWAYKVLVHPRPFWVQPPFPAGRTVAKVGEYVVVYSRQ